MDHKNSPWTVLDLMHRKSPSEKEMGGHYCQIGCQIQLGRLKFDLMDDYSPSAYMEYLSACISQIQLLFFVYADEWQE